MINGNTSGIKQHILDDMENMYELTCGKDEFVSKELIFFLATYTSVLNREISVFISRAGKVLDVSIGDNDHVELPYLRIKRGNDMLSGVRCIHTHPNGNANLSSIDISTLLSSRLDAMAAISVKDGSAAGISVAYIGEQLDRTVQFGPYSIYRFPQELLIREIYNATRRVSELVRLQQTDDDSERAVLVLRNTNDREVKELSMLADTAGAKVLGNLTQNNVRDESGYYIGKGKLKDLNYLLSNLNANLVITNDELTGVEQRNLEHELGIKVVDRTTLILDIFARHAKTKEGKVQVELAQLKYMLPRLTGTGVSLSRLGAGIGTRGPGETKLETDRRRIRRKIFELEEEIKKLAKQRQLRRNSREKNRIPEIAIVGYTNAGKTSLLNLLADESLYSEDKLFATLDPVTRKITLPSGKDVLLTDTVGFIDKLPHDLVSAFKSTLEETLSADFIMILTDISDPDHAVHEGVVNNVLTEIGVKDTPIIHVYNKTDMLDEDDIPSNIIGISAKEKKGIGHLLNVIDEKLRDNMVRISVKLKYSEGSKLSKLQQYGKDLNIEYNDDHMLVTADMPEKVLKQLRF
ncbi:MAG: GTPase HflX [Clostridia bacterium]|nr:GTPase HflX [Clostridia bacterium]